MSDDSAARLDFVKSEVDSQMARFKRRRRRDKRKAFSLQMATVALSATISVLLGLRSLTGLEDLFANIALALGALITVLAAADAFFSHRDLWILRTRTVRELEGLAREIEYYQRGLGTNTPERTDVDAFFDRLGEVVKKDNDDWGRLRTPSIPAGTEQ
jgi:hypothetical protein